MHASRRERQCGGIAAGTMKTCDAYIIILTGYFYLMHINKRQVVCLIYLLDSCYALIIDFYQIFLLRFLQMPDDILTFTCI